MRRLPTTEAMGATGLRRAVAARSADDLDTLDAPAVLRALCDGPPTAEGLLRGMHASEATAATTFDRWAGTATEPFASVFAENAEREVEHARRVSATLQTGASAPGPPTEPGPLHAYLRGLEVPAARVGAGLVGRPLSSLRTYARIRTWAAAQGCTTLERLAGELAEETQPSFTTAADLLGEVAPDSERWSTAVDAGVYAIRIVRDDHEDALVSLDRDAR